MPDASAVGSGSRLVGVRRDNCWILGHLRRSVNAVELRRKPVRSIDLTVFRSHRRSTDPASELVKNQMPTDMTTTVASTL
jgi:hypothetical protein